MSQDLLEEVVNAVEVLQYYTILVNYLNCTFSTFVLINLYDKYWTGSFFWITSDVILICNKYKHEK